MCACVGGLRECVGEGERTEVNIVLRRVVADVCGFTSLYEID